MASSIRPFSTSAMSPRTLSLMEVVDIEVAPEGFVGGRENWELRRGLEPASRSCLTSRRGACGPAFGEQSVAGECAAAVHDDDTGERDPDEVVLEAFAARREIPEPVHEEPVRRV